MSAYGPNVQRALDRARAPKPVAVPARPPQRTESPLMALLGFVLVVSCIAMFGVVSAIALQPLVN